ncbi:hypothetical protein E1A91_A01G054900v1 [Gossypium mustelinum]|uniref:Leucine-rich repeat-containing N-terminal plant-type domain-containing protein n=1 Tax=Gossypium mustelinum TaxID=34275 RepID=A0A5D3ADD3_GOSMU|nr:hypothetical protein E1A91_A01G054900v1 [Gossypium mustelinum]
MEHGSKGKERSFCPSPNPHPATILGFTLDISDNDLSSTLSSSKSSFLSSLENCRFLSYLSFARNPLISGYLPASIGNQSSSLKHFDASSCNISGRIPGDIGKWNLVEYVDFSGNQFSGTIPDRVCVRKNNLRFLSLHENKLEGILPLSLINCSELQVLNVANNNLSDTFPHWLGMLPKLLVLFFQNLKSLKEEANYGYADYQYSVNLTTKCVEREFKIKELRPIFSCIDLSDNGFHGEIPKVVGELRSLHALNLSHNSLTGPIPPSFGNLAALESLDLSFNKLSGRIPSQLTNLTFLEVLRFSNNNFVGPIPHGKQFDTFDSYSYQGNLGLCGFPLSKECSNDERSEPEQDEEDNGNGIAFIWKVAMMGYGCGMVLGISMAYIVFTTGRPWWLVRMIERDLRNKVSS